MDFLSYNSYSIDDLYTEYQKATCNRYNLKVGLYQLCNWTSTEITLSIESPTCIECFFFEITSRMTSAKSLKDEITTYLYLRVKLKGKERSI
jgi:hypothetical protein